MDATVIYYTANIEDEMLARKVRQAISANCKDLPIISVSRKPIDFGENICVGEKPICVANAWRQIYVGLQAAKTTFVIAVEGDTFYPPQYFSFIPPDTVNFYRYNNIWVLYLWPSKRYAGKFWKKPSQMEGAQICGREHWMHEMERLMDVNDWSDVINPPVICAPIVKKEFTWMTGAPVLTCKTDKGLFRYTTRSIVSATELPIWGTVENVMRSLKEEQ